MQEICLERIYWKDLSWLHFDDESRVQVWQQVKENLVMKSKYFCRAFLIILFCKPQQRYFDLYNQSIRYISLELICFWISICFKWSISKIFTVKQSCIFDWQINNLYQDHHTGNHGMLPLQNWGWCQKF